MIRWTIEFDWWPVANYYAGLVAGLLLARLNAAGVRCDQ